MKGKFVIVTGANTGMGKVTSLELAKKGAHVIMVCRNKTLGEAAQKDIVQKSGNTNVDLLIADLSYQQSIRELATVINTSYPHIDVLVNNAGIIQKQKMALRQLLQPMFYPCICFQY